MSNEFFPPTESELEEMIATIKKRLEKCTDNDEGSLLILELEAKEKQLQQLIIQNNAL